MIRVYTTHSRSLDNGPEEVFYLLLLVVVGEDVNDSDDVNTAFIVSYDSTSEFLKKIRAGVGEFGLLCGLGP
jgi:hypothetical protein